LFDIVKSFVEEIAAAPGGKHIKACIQCGICTGSCPAASEMEFPVKEKKFLWTKNSDWTSATRRRDK